MAFQFLCPQGHLLECEDSQAGQQLECPQCQSRFVVPQPTPAAPAEQTIAGEQAVVSPPAPGQPMPGQLLSGQPLSDQPMPEQPLGNQPAPGPTAAPGAPAVDTGFNLEGRPPADVTGLPGSTEQAVVHIICPNGHELETPREMLGEEAMCPHCGVQFRLRLEESREYSKAREESRERKEMQAGKTWMYWAIAVAIAAVMGLFILLAVSAEG